MNNRLLGTIAMICAPAMLLEAVVPNSDNMPVLVGTASMIFMAGSFCSHLGLWRIAATGKNWWGRGVLVLQLVLVALAFLFGFFEATGLITDENPLFMITDIAWPLSMVAMNFVGITTAVVGKLPGWKRFSIIPCGLTFPLGILFSVVTGMDMQSQATGLFFFGMLAAFWAVMGFVVRQSEDTVSVQAPVFATSAK